MLTVRFYNLCLTYSWLMLKRPDKLQLFGVCGVPVCRPMSVSVEVEVDGGRLPLQLPLILD